MGIVPALIALGTTLVALYFVERLGNRRSVAWRSAENDGLAPIEEGLFIVKGKLISDEDSVINLGSSVERTSEISANPELISTGFTVELPSGIRLFVPPGKKVHTQGIIGAERKLLRAVTGKDGIENHYSFELKAGAEFFLFARNPQRIKPPADGPFRSNFAYPVEPTDSDKSLVYVSAKQPQQWISGCTTPIIVVLLLFAIPAAMMAWQTAMTVVMVLGFCSLMMQAITLPDVPPASLLAHAEQSRRTRVRADVSPSKTEQAPDDHQTAEQNEQSRSSRLRS